jgi:uncharacterized membrane protein
MCTAQSLTLGSNGARLVEWEIDGFVRGMAVPDDGDPVIVGWTTVDLGGGQLTDRPALWHVRENGAVDDVELPLPSTGGGVVNGISRNGKWAGGVTRVFNTVIAGALWEIGSSTPPRVVGDVVLGGEGQPVPALSSSVVAVQDDGTSFGVSIDPGNLQYGILEQLGQHATIVPFAPSTPGLVSNMFPVAASRDGTVIAGSSYFSEEMIGTYPRATLWHPGDDSSQLIFEDDSTSFANAVSPNGRYVGGYFFSEQSDSEFGHGFILDLQADEVISLSDPSNTPWNSPVLDVSDDGRVAVGDHDSLSSYSSLTDNGGFIAIDGVAHRFAEWLEENFALGGLSINVVRTVYRDSDTYHFAAMQREAEGPNTAYYISIPVNALLPSPLPGDFNNDGVVDAADYVKWRKDLGATRTQADYDIWRANFGSTIVPVSITNSTVPEPTSLALLLLAAAAQLLQFYAVRGSGRSSPENAST